MAGCRLPPAASVDASGSSRPMARRARRETSGEVPHDEDEPPRVLSEGRRPRRSRGSRLLTAFPSRRLSGRTARVPRRVGAGTTPSCRGIPPAVLSPDRRYVLRTARSAPGAGDRSRCIPPYRRVTGGIADRRSMVRARALGRAYVGAAAGIGRQFPPPAVRTRMLTNTL